MTEHRGCNFAPQFCSRFFTCPSTVWRPEWYLRHSTSYDSDVKRLLAPRNSIHTRAPAPPCAQALPRNPLLLSLTLGYRPLNGNGKVLPIVSSLVTRPYRRPFNSLLRHCCSHAACRVRGGDTGAAGAGAGAECASPRTHDGGAATLGSISDGRGVREGARVGKVLAICESSPFGRRRYLRDIHVPWPCNPPRLLDLRIAEIACENFPTFTIANSPPGVVKENGSRFSLPPYNRAFTRSECTVLTSIRTLLAETQRSARSAGPVACEL